jgi:hypothetical protein
VSEHPAPVRLDAFAAGDRDEEVAQHIASCTACATYVEQASALNRAFAETEGEKSADFVLGLHDRQTTAPFNRKSFGRASWIAGTFLAAAAVLLVISNREPASNPPNGAAIRFKGGMQVAIIRDRAGDQARLIGEVRVRPGDRLRAEISVDDSRPLEVGFLGKDGTWILLHAPVLVEAGTYFSERAAEFDSSPTEGWVIAGRPEDVSRARTTRSFGDVSALPVVAEP